jgi:hypothetical protein
MNYLAETTWHLKPELDKIEGYSFAYTRLYPKVSGFIR